MTEQTKLTPEQIAAIAGRLATYRGRIATWGGLSTEHAQDAAVDIAALLADRKALEAEIARLREIIGKIASFVVEYYDEITHGLDLALDEIERQERANG